jgi:hypothetical protein
MDIVRSWEVSGAGSVDIGDQSQPVPKQIALRRMSDYCWTRAGAAVMTRGSEWRFSPREKVNGPPPRTSVRRR